MRSCLVAAVALAACAADPPPACIVVDTDCAILYEPTFHKDGCGSTKTSCHSDAGKRGGMTFATEQQAYDALLDRRVVPGDPACSAVVVRTSSPGADYEMPVGSPLSAPERCVIIKWVLGGAMR
ncbi:MAG: hypothetical protein NT062_12805 [Proteobacteria bacterium]|nr:hypothetical protein [Pseudomonadota bacterium]